MVMISPFVGTPEGVQLLAVLQSIVLIAPQVRDTSVASMENRAGLVLETEKELPEFTEVAVRLAGKLAGPDSFRLLV
jgi:hypothetical protein